MQLSVVRWIKRLATLVGLPWVGQMSGNVPADVELEGAALLALSR